MVKKPPGILPGGFFVRLCASFSFQTETARLAAYDAAGVSDFRFGAVYYS
jgi:hypothetical protein